MSARIIRTLSALTALAMVFTLAACGKSKEEVPETPQYVYKSNFSPVTGEVNGELNVQAYTQDGVYATCQEKVGRDIPATADVENLTEDELSRFDVYATAIYFIGGNGKAEKLENYKPLDGEPDTQNRPNYYSQSDLAGLAVSSDGKLLAVETVFTGWYDGPEDIKETDDSYYDYYKSYQKAYIRTLDTDGTELKTAPMAMDAGEYLIARSLLDADGNLLCTVETELRAYNSDGELIYSIDNGDYVQSVLKLSDGAIYAALWSDSITLCPVDTEAETFGKGIPIPDDAYDSIPGGGDYDLYYSSGLTFYGFDLETQTATPLFNWVNCDVNRNELGLAQVDAEGTVHALLISEDGTDSYNNELVEISRQPYDPNAESKTLTLACMSLEDTIQSAVISFNRGNNGARIEIKDYSQYNTTEDSEAGSQKFLTEAMAGDVADIIAMDSLPFRRIASKGLLEDLYPYLDADSQLSREDFFPNVLDAMTVDGKLCGVTSSFYVAAVMGATSVVGDRESWTYDEFKEALASMPQGCEPFEEGVSRDDILRSCLVLDMPDYVNWGSGKCSFDSDQFKALLEFAAGFPAPLEDGAPMDDTETTQNRIQSGQQMLLATSIYRLDDVLYDQTYFGGVPVRYIGFPTYSGNGNALMTQGGIAMSSTCRDKDAAWSFLRSFLTEDYQKTNVWSIPTNLAAYDYKLGERMKTTYMIDDNGQYVLDENGEKIKEPRYTLSMDDGPTVNVYALTQEQADEVTRTIRAVTKSYDYDESIINIAMEQSAGYFAGQKTADEVAKLVQSKANIYVNEQG